MPELINAAAAAANQLRRSVGVSPPAKRGKFADEIPESAREVH